MDTKQQFLVPAGTTVRTRNIVSELKLRRYVTRQDLYFDDLLNSGDGGSIYYFRHGDWLIAVDADEITLQLQDHQSSAELNQIENMESGAGKLDTAA